MKAIYPGTFDPITNGHMDIAKRAASLCDHLVLAVSENKSKNTMFSIEERVEMAQEALRDVPNIEVVPFKCLLVNFMKKIGASAVIRGLRAVSDFEFELQLALMNREMYKDCETVFLMPKNEYIFLSSSIVREIASHNGDVANFVPISVQIKLNERFGDKKDIPC